MGWEGMVGGEDGQGVREKKKAQGGTVWVPGMGGVHLQGHVCLK
jgi:hypothetical protein